MKTKLRGIGMYGLGKANQYYHSNQHERQALKEALEKGLSVLRGFKLTLTPLDKTIYLQIDVCSRVLQKRNLLEIFNGHARDDNKAEFEGSTIITKYGRYRTYKIEEIDYNMSPMTKFSQG